MIQWNTELLSYWIAPGISEFTSAEIPSLEHEFDQGSFWFQNHFLNSALGPRFQGIYRQYVMILLLRSQNAFHIYHVARRLTMEYLEGNQPDSPKLTSYLSAINQWENFSIQYQVVVDVFNKMNKSAGITEMAFRPGDASPEQRMYEIGNNVKHAAEKVIRRKLDEAEALPIWLSNQGLRSYGGLQVEFTEIAGLLRDVAKLADQHQNPSSFTRKSPAP